MRRVTNAKNLERGRVALVTGAAGNIGRTICLLLAERGIAILAADLSLSGARATAAAVRRTDARAHGIEVNIAREESVLKCYEAGIKKFGHINILVHCAAICKETPPLEISVAEWDQIMDVNLRGTFLMCREALRHMQPRGYGRVIAIASLAGKIGGLVAGAHYAASKAGVIGLVKSLARHAAAFKVTVNAVCPGPIHTAMTRNWDAEANRRFAEGIPLKEYGQPGDVAEAVAFLASDAARYITGEILDVNGGALMD